jgi:hypothetical protein
MHSSETAVEVGLHFPGRTRVRRRPIRHGTALVAPTGADTDTALSRAFAITAREHFRFSLSSIAAALGARTYRHGFYTH